MERSVPFVRNGDDVPGLVPLWNDLEARYGAVPALLGAIANSPDLLRAWSDFVSALRTEDGLNNARMQEMVILRVAARTDNQYEFERHLAQVRKKGLLSDSEVAELRAPCSSFQSGNHGDRALVQMVDDVVQGRRIADWAIASVGSEVSLESIVRTVVLAAFYVAVDRIIKALDIHLADDEVPKKT
jgi:hypothetical protein